MKPGKIAPTEKGKGTSITIDVDVSEPDKLTINIDTSLKLDYVQVHELLTLAKRMFIDFENASK